LGRLRENARHYARGLWGTKMTIHHFSSILIVDDSGAVRSVVRKLLTQLGFKNIDEAPDGEAALEKISEQHFSLVISDWNMEPMSGQILLESVRAEKKYANLPFIMMTADPSIEKIVQAKKAGVTCFIKKPFRAEELQAKILQTNTSKQSTAEVE
jgi:two-component system chemotaxis response regulator CheY